MGKGEKEERKRDSCSSDSFFFKREREQEDSCSSEPTVESQIVHKKRKLNRPEMWNDDWDTPFLDILDGTCAGTYPFTNSSWQLIATSMQEVVNHPLIKELKPDDCKKRGKHFRKMYRHSKAINDPSPDQEQLRRIFSPKNVPKFPRTSANSISFRSLLSRTMSRGSRSGSGSKSKSGVKQWKSDLFAALGNLVAFHNLNFQAVDDISDNLDTEVRVKVFLCLNPDMQMREVKRLIGPRAFIMPVESPPSASTQLG